MIRWLGRQGLDTYVYAPKADPFHRDRWREHYPGSELSRFRRLVVTGRKARVRVVYAIAPGLDMCYSGAADRDALSAKLGQLAGIGIRTFMLAFDDVARAFHCAGDVQRYGNPGRGLGRAHRELANETLLRLRLRYPGARIVVVPTDYSKRGPTPYLSGLVSGLERSVDVAWTGPYAVPSRITARQARTIARVYGRRPLLWDNYPVNDYAPRRLHLGPVSGRAASLPGLLSGYLANPMNQAEASKVALLTVARYLRSPATYRPGSAWRSAVGRGPLRLFADRSSRTATLDDPRPVWPDDALLLRPALLRVAESLAGAAWRAPVADLARELRRQARLELAKTPLAVEVAPWVARVRADAEIGRAALQVIRLSRPALRYTVRGSLVRGRATLAAPEAVSAAARRLEVAWRSAEAMTAQTPSGASRFLAALAELHARCRSDELAVTVGVRRVRLDARGRFRLRSSTPRRVAARTSRGLSTGVGAAGPVSDAPLRARLRAFARAVRAESEAGLTAIYAPTFRSIDGTHAADELAAWRRLFDASRLRYAAFRPRLVAHGPGRCRRHAVVWTDWVVAGRLPPPAPSSEDSGTLGDSAAFLFRDNRVVYSAPASP